MSPMQKLGTAIRYGALFAILATTTNAAAQGSRKDDVAFGPLGRPIAGATVRVCASSGAGTPCSPLASIFSDVALTQPLGNPVTTDGLGNYHFYAMPGRYQLQITAPGGTTTTIPDVILPNDPSAPTFSSVTTTGAVSAFSLSLSGNLTVGGNVNVTGALVSNSFNPSTIATNSLSVGGGAPVTNSSNIPQTTAANTWQGDQHFKSGVAWYDMCGFGTCSGGLNTNWNAQASCTNGSTTVTLGASGWDFANGMGITVAGCGPADTLSTPAAPTVLQKTTITGSTTYYYKVRAIDANGGLTAASPAGSIATAAALGVVSATVTTFQRTNGTVTVTMASSFPVQVGAVVALNSVGGFGAHNCTCNGSFVVGTVTDSTHWSFYQAGMANTTLSGGTAYAVSYLIPQLTNANIVANAVGYLWYRSTDNVTYTMLGPSWGNQQPWLIDRGQTTEALLPHYWPTTADATVYAGLLVTTVVSGGNTNTMTVANAASTTATNVDAYHDDTPLLSAALTAMAANHGGVVFIPTLQNYFKFYQFNSRLVFPNLSGGYGQIWLGNGVNINWPWELPHGGYSFYGKTGGGNANHSVALGNGSYMYMQGGANPLVYIGPPNPAGFGFYNLVMSCGQNFQTCLISDEASDGSGSTGFVFRQFAADSSGATGSGASIIIRGGFDVTFDEANVGPSTSWPNDASIINPSVWFQVGYNVTGGVAAGTGIVFFHNFKTGGNGIFCDMIGDPSSNGACGNIIADGILTESGTGPVLRVDTFGNNILTGTMALRNVSVADYTGGFGTPIFDFTGTPRVAGLQITSPGQVNGIQPVITFDLSCSPSTTCDTANTFLNLPACPQQALCGVVGSASGNQLLTARLPGDNQNTVEASSMWFQTGPMSLSKAAYVFVPLPAATGLSASLASGGSLTVGTTYYYVITPVDWQGADGPVSAEVSATPTSGNQKVSLTWTCSTGVKGYDVFRYTISGTHYQLNHAVPTTTTCSFTDDGSLATTPVQAESITAPAGGDPLVAQTGLYASQLYATGHLNQGAANQDLAGTITLSGGTATYTFAKAFASAPLCFAQDQTTIANTASCSTTTTSATFTGTGTDVVKYLIVGNPN